MRRVFETYLASLTKLRHQLDDAQSRAEPAAMRLAVHTLKSSSANVGALNLAKLCTEVEHAIRDADADAAPVLVNRLRAEADRVDTAVRRLLVELSGA